MRRRRRWPKVVTAAGAVAMLAAGCAHPREPQRPVVIDGPYASLLAASADLGPSDNKHVQLTAALHRAAEPGALIDWARQRALSVRWRPGQRWAVVEGSAGAVAAAFGVAVHDYRGRRGQVFYASPEQPAVPAELDTEIAELGRILGYTPHREYLPFIAPRDVPDRGLSPQALLRTYNAAPLAEQGYTGKGSTVLVFAFDGVDQSDLDMFADEFGLPRFTPELIGPMAERRSGEATMDLQAVHAMAPDATKVLVNALPTVSGDGAYEKIGAMMADADRRYPGAVWSFSIGWGCDKLITAADLEPARQALQAAHRNGSTAFNASGDLAGLECKGGQDWSAPPGPDDIGLDSVASLPEMTDVGGTTLSTDSEGNWISEQSWFDPPLSQGTGGGVSALFDRPPWQSRLDLAAPPMRLTPDVAALADPFTGMRIVYQGKPAVGGGTSLSAPIWAGFAAIINQYLSENGGGPIGNLNPLLYEMAQGARLPGFRDITLGGNAVDSAGPGYDLTTGLGSPNIDNLARNLLALQRSAGR